VTDRDRADLRAGANAPEEVLERIWAALSLTAAALEDRDRSAEVRAAAEATWKEAARIRAESAATRADASERQDLVRELQDLVANLQVALVTRATIDQAKGILMAAQGCTPDEAFDLLRRASQRENRKLHDVAADIVARTIQRHAQGERGSGDGGDRVEGSGGAGELHDPGDLRRGSDEGRPT
jgi:hypothetical protein